MLEEKIRKLINTDEDEYHDFKVEWYNEHQKDEMIKDIFSFVNTAHHQDCYLIFGIHDGDRKVVGIEKDSNRLNTETLTEYLNSLPIANRDIPKIVVKTINIGDHLIDILIIKDTSDVPVYLKEECHPKKCKHVIRAGQIFCRMNGTETSITGTASDYQVEQLWKKRFGLDLSISDQYKVKLLDVDNWEYFENDQVGFRYNVDPDYCMYLVDDKERRNRVESYSLSQSRIRMDWQVLKLMYRGQLLKNILVVWLDGARFLTVTPMLADLNQGLPGEMLTFQYICEDSIDFYVENFLLSSKEHAISSDHSQRNRLLKDIVIFKDRNQLKTVCDLLKNQISEIKEKVKPTNDQLELCKGKMSFDFSKKDMEFSNTNIEYMCQEKNVSEYINNFIATKTSLEIPNLLYLD